MVWVLPLCRRAKRRYNGAQSGTSMQLFVIPSLNTVIAVVANTSGTIREVTTVAGKLINITQQKD
tara:strand:+ start:7417 stop:7611 length:195 start_codon:yes stop_codon:yes gene_type:complete